MRRLITFSLILLAVTLQSPRIWGGQEGAEAESRQTHRFEHSSTWKKPSSESHQWSYDGACRNCLAEIERRHGVDWKVTDIEFEDKGRTTKTHTSWTGARTWRCTHTVVAKYSIVRRGHERSGEDRETIASDLTITYKMLNPFYNSSDAAPERNNPSKSQSSEQDRENERETSRTHRFEHSSSWSKPSSESHQWSYDGACRNCLAEVERRHGVDWKVTDVEFEDKGRSTRTSQDWRGRRTWRCTHTVVARYNVVRRGHELAELDQEFITTVLNLKYRMKNPDYEEGADSD